MVSGVEFKVCDPFPHINWTFFVQKWSKSCHFWPKMNQNEHLSDVSPIIMSYRFLIFIFNIICNTLLSCKSERFILCQFNFATFRAFMGTNFDFLGKKWFFLPIPL